MTSTILLSFDIEEFDMPMEYGKTIPLERQLDISRRGTEIILDILRSSRATATFFSTVVFAQNSQPLIRRIIDEGHELASHGYYHSDFKEEHLLQSKLALESLSGNRVDGFRMPRMQPVSDTALQRAGYAYNSSLNPTFLPGRYNHLDKPRKIFRKGDIWQLPASVTPSLRFPLFWLSFHNVPLAIYHRACSNVLDEDGYLNIYFHPWEFTDLHDPSLGLPWYVRRNSGASMVERFKRTLTKFNGDNCRFSDISSFVNAQPSID